MQHDVYDRKNQTDRAIEVKRIHEAFLERTPCFQSAGVGFITVANGHRTDEIGILVSVMATDGNPLTPRKFSLPFMLDGVPVQVIEEPPHKPWGFKIIYHRPLMAGIRVTSPAKGSGTNVGTLTGLATYHHDNTQVLVTALHVVTGDDKHQVSNNEELYQIETNIPDQKIGTIIKGVEISDAPGAPNVADAAIFRIVGSVPTSFEPHTQSTGEVHDESNYAGLIIAGTVDPQPGMDLKYLAPNYGVRDVIVESIGHSESLGNYSFQDVVHLDLGANIGGQGDSGAPCLFQVGAKRFKMACIVAGGPTAVNQPAFGSIAVDKASALKASVVESKLDITFGAPVAKANIQEVLDTGKRLGQVLRRLTVPIKKAPDVDTPDNVLDTGMSRCSLTYSPPITFVREGTWAKGTWESSGPGGVGYFPIKLNKDARVVGTEYEWPHGLALPDDGVVMDAPVVSGPVDNQDNTYSKSWTQHIKYVERDLLFPENFRNYATRIEFDLIYTVTYDSGKTWSTANYVIDNIEGNRDDGILWANYEVIEKADARKQVWRTSVGADGIANFPPSASYPIRNQQAAWAVLRQVEGADEERARLQKYLAEEMADDEFPDGWRWDYMDFMWGWAWGDTAYEDIPGHVLDATTGRLPEEVLSYYLNAHKTWYQSEFGDQVPVGPGSYPYRDRTRSAAASLAYREAIWFWSRSYRLKAAIDTLCRLGEEKLADVHAMLDEAGWDGRGPAKSLLGLHGSLASSPGYKGYWLASFAMACNVVWRYAKFAGNAVVMEAVEPLCHETAQRVLDLRVPASGFYNEIDAEGNLVERVYPDIAGWVLDAYDWDVVGERYVSRAWIPPLAVAAETFNEFIGLSKPFQLDWNHQANVSYESTLMYWKALDMYVGNFG